MRRQFAPHPLGTVWFYPWDGTWPMRPWIGMPEGGRLHEIGASGWGCMLIHREVVEKMRVFLKGELEVFEDPMDIYPYDLTKIFQAIGGLRQLSDNPPKKINLLPALREHTRTLEEEIRPLKVTKDRVGSDIRFPFYARELGYQLMGDPETEVVIPRIKNDLVELFEAAGNGTLDKVKLEIDSRACTTVVVAFEEHVA